MRILHIMATGQRWSGDLLHRHDGSRRRGVQQVAVIRAPPSIARGGAFRRRVPRCAGEPLRPLRRGKLPR